MFFNPPQKNYKIAKYEHRHTQYTSAVTHNSIGKGKLPYQVAFTRIQQ